MAMQQQNDQRYGLAGGLWGAQGASIGAALNQPQATWYNGTSTATYSNAAALQGALTTTANSLLG